MASSSSLRTLREVARQPNFIPAVRYLSGSYTPSSSSFSDTSPLPRPPRPESPAFFTGKPTYNSAITSLETALSSAQSQLRAERVYPFPTHLPAPQPPRASWLNAQALGNLLGTGLKTSSHRRVVDLLNELHLLRYVAGLCDMPAVKEDLEGVLRRYEREGARREDGTEGVDGGEESASGARLSKKGKEGGVDEFGRAYGMGRRKESSARVWIIPSAAGRAALPSSEELLTSPSSVTPAEDAAVNASSSTTTPSAGEATTADSTTRPSSDAVAAAAPTPTPVSEILINHLPLSSHFPRSSDREAILRPFRLTGLLGAYNVFALVRGGGTTGQAGAVALGLSRALVAMREDVRDVLFKDGALMRDTRMVERKKTGKAKARKKYAWVKR